MTREITRKQIESLTIDIERALHNVKENKTRHGSYFRENSENISTETQTLN